MEKPSPNSTRRSTGESNLEDVSQKRRRTTASPPRASLPEACELSSSGQPPTPADRLQLARGTQPLQETPGHHQLHLHAPYGPGDPNTKLPVLERRTDVTRAVYAPLPHQQPGLHYTSTQSLGEFDPDPIMPTHHQAGRSLQSSFKLPDAAMLAPRLNVPTGHNYASVGGQTSFDAWATASDTISGGLSYGNVAAPMSAVSATAMSEARLAEQQSSLGPGFPSGHLGPMSVFATALPPEANALMTTTAGATMPIVRAQQQAEALLGHGVLSQAVAPTPMAPTVPISVPRTEQQHVVERQPIVLSMSCDKEFLTTYQCLIREQIEIFEAGDRDVTNTQGRNKAVVRGQVGIRCKHCSMIEDPSLRTRGAVYFPSKLDRIYQAAQNMAAFHFCDQCPIIADDKKQTLVSLRESRKKAGGGRRYWAENARTLGVYEADGCLRFDHRRKY